jgi:hypothetical protein
VMREAARRPTKVQVAPIRQRPVPGAPPCRRAVIPTLAPAGQKSEAVVRQDEAPEARQPAVAPAQRAEAHPNLALRAAAQEAVEPTQAAAAARPMSARQAEWVREVPAPLGLQVRLGSPAAGRPTSRRRAGSTRAPGRQGASAPRVRVTPPRESPRSPGLTGPATKQADPSLARPPVEP